MEQLRLFELKTRAQSKELGQFFTDPKIADYMASMIDFNEDDSARLLDAGAGSGALTSSVAYRCLELGKKQVHAVLYEIDKNILPKLEKRMDDLNQIFKLKGKKFSYKIHNEDFVLSRPDKQQNYKFNISIINPPYFKYNSGKSPYSGATSDLFKGDPNIYASFTAIVSECLMPKGEMIVIIPRSFTNGLYFKGFRNYLQSNMSLERIHIFRSRNQLFKNMEVLQENIICQYVKTEQISNIKISSSNCSKDLKKTKINLYPSKLIFDNHNQHKIIRIPESNIDGYILNIVSKWSNDLEKNGYYISTGPVVKFRTKEFITKKSYHNSIPLLQMHNVKVPYFEWTGKHKKDAYFSLKEGYEKHVSKNTIYVLLKRFTSKEERRRLVASVYDPSKIKGDLIGLENHLNYIGLKNTEMNLFEALGLAALFNSTLMDRYFRAMSGNTQVNATDIRLLKLPPRGIIIKIGKEIENFEFVEQTNLDKVVNNFLNIEDQLKN